MPLGLRCLLFCWIRSYARIGGEKRAVATGVSKEDLIRGDSRWNNAPEFG